MQTIGKESHISREKSNSQFSTERNAIRGSQCDRLSQQNTCDANHRNECEWSGEDSHFSDECKRRPKSNPTKVKTEEEVILHFSNVSNDSVMKSQTKDIPNDYSKRPVSDIEELRTDGKDWHYFHTSTSTPTSNENVFPDLNISSISLEESDSDFLYERQISRFQITDEFINSSVFDGFDYEDKQNE